MEFVEASKALDEGKAIRRKCWPNKIHFIKTKDNKIQVFKEYSEIFNIYCDVILSNDWVVLEEKNVKISFALALEKLKNGHKIAMYGWPDSKFLQLSEDGAHLIIKKIDKTCFTPSMECLFSNDWEIIQ